MDPKQIFTTLACSEWSLKEENVNKYTFYKFIQNYHERDNYKNDYQIVKYGHLRLQYLKNHKNADYTIMLLDGTLRKHIVDTDKQAKERFEILMKQMLEKNPINEELKNTDTLKWVGLMNNYKHSVEEVIFKELIYC